VEDMGVRAFNAAEDPKTKASLAEPRRLARSARRRLRRRAGRLRRAKDLFVQYGLIPEERRESAFITIDSVTPWRLRADGLGRMLTGEEFARALFHIVKRRGFKSNRKKVKAENDDGKMLAGIGANRQVMLEKGYRTAGEMFDKDDKFAQRKRNTTDSYENTVDRELLEEEIKTLFARQRELGNANATEDFEADILEVFNWQKPYASGNQIIRMIGTCTFEKGELRAPRYCYHAERFTLLSKINSLTYTLNGDRLWLTDDQRAIVESMAYEKSKVTYAQIRKELQLDEEARFTGLMYLHKPEKGADLQESLKCEESTCC